MAMNSYHFIGPRLCFLQGSTFDAREEKEREISRTMFRIAIPLCHFCCCFLERIERLLQWFLHFWICLYWFKYTAKPH